MFFLQRLDLPWILSLLEEEVGIELEPMLDETVNEKDGDEEGLSWDQLVDDNTENDVDVLV